jgi:ribosome maturation factor RimP
MTQRGRADGGPSSRRPAAGRREGARQPRQAGGPRLDPAARRERLREVVEPVVAASGYDLEELTVARAGRRHVVRVIVDGDGGITLDGVAVVSRAISAALDEAEESGGELLAGEYQLEVSSPGIDRPLLLPRHWRRNLGRLVAVSAAGRELTGRVTAADDAGIVLDVDGTAHEIGYADLGPGRVQIEFNRVEEAELDEADDDTDEDDDEDDDEDGGDVDEDEEDEDR